MWKYFRKCSQSFTVTTRYNINQANNILKPDMFILFFSATCLQCLFFIIFNYNSFALKARRLFVYKLKKLDSSSPPQYHLMLNICLSRPELSVLVFSGVEHDKNENIHSTVSTISNISLFLHQLTAAPATWERQD